MLAEDTEKQGEAMVYENMIKGKFISRPNRFIAHVEIDGREEICHVKNTGRCREILLPDAEVWIQEVDGVTRKTKYDLIAVRKGKRLINIDSQAPNKVFHEWLLTDNSLLNNMNIIKPEYLYKSSRLDFYIKKDSREIVVEIKGVTLEKEGVVLFPDAPTERGIKHIHHLCQAVEQGLEAYMFFIIQMKDILYFTPNYETHPAFGEALIKAREMGVNIFALDCDVGADFIRTGNFVEVRF